MTQLQLEKRRLGERISSISSLKKAEDINRLLDALDETEIQTSDETDFLLALAHQGRAQIAAGQVSSWQNVKTAMKQGREEGVEIRKQKGLDG